jgi:hypothetical protein
LAVSWAKQGPPGIPGTPGTPGTNGTNGVSGYQIVSDSIDFPVGTSAAGDFNVGCPDNKIVVGGGGRIFDSNFSEEPGNFDVEQSFPGPQGHSWTITYHANGLGLAFTVTVYAICENPSS